MTGRQIFMRWLYPLLMRLNGNNRQKGIMLQNEQMQTPPTPFHELEAVANDGSTLRFADWAGRKTLIVNTASDCGYTRQLEELQQLYEQYRDQLIIVGFPANDFHGQEPGSDAAIAEFCQLNYGVTFPLARKSSVVKGTAQNLVFQWLTDPAYNGWNQRAPDWNFGKYLINEQGVLTHFFGTAVSPLDERVVNALRS